MDETPATVPLAEVLATLSLATDLAMGQPMEHGLRACLLAVGLAECMGVDRDTAHDVYELALLQWVGCTSHAHELSGWFDDEIAAHRRSSTFDFGRPLDIAVDLVRYAGVGRSPLHRARTVAGALARGPSAVQDLFASSCEVAGRLADRFAVRQQVRDGLQHVFARWDGRGWPPEARADQVSLCARVVHVAQDAAVFHRVGGTGAAVDAVRRRSGHAHDPAVADVFLANADAILAAAERLSLWDAALDAEPGNRHHLTGGEIDDALEAIGDFVDLKSPWTAGHSRGVARLVDEAARAQGHPARTLRHAALVHDLGRVAVPNGIWEKAGPLTAAEWEQVRLHPYLTERILARSKSLRHLAGPASLHHERLDGSGYHHGAHADTLPHDARLLAAADAYQALVSDRPHRQRRDAEAASARLTAEAVAGRLDAGAVAAIVGSGAESAGRSAMNPGGLTDREVEVLRLLARGLTLKQVAAALAISEKTAGHHAEHIYRKLDIRSRAAAALFAAQHGVV